MADRNIGEALDQMVAVKGLPEGHKKTLKKFGSNLRYSAPEQLNSKWGELGEICSDMVGGKSPRNLNEWERALIEILINDKLYA